MSKHQQVQLLEAASVLVNMNQEGSAVVEMNMETHSHPSSTSPAASGSSASRDEMSSDHTTPPPGVDDEYAFTFAARERRASSAKRRSSTTSTYSRSYQSLHSVPSPWGGQSPGTSAVDRPGATSVDDEADLAAAVGLLSCSFGTPKSGPLSALDDVPPVPPLPARYVTAPSKDHVGDDMRLSREPAGQSVPGSQRASGYGDSTWRPKEGADGAIEEEGDSRRSTGRIRSDEDDESIFGRMEE